MPSFLLSSAPGDTLTPSVWAGWQCALAGYYGLLVSSWTILDGEALKGPDTVLQMLLMSSSALINVLLFAWALSSRYGSRPLRLPLAGIGLLLAALWAGSAWSHSHLYRGHWMWVAGIALMTLPSMLTAPDEPAASPANG